MKKSFNSQKIKAVLIIHLLFFTKFYSQTNFCGTSSQLQNTNVSNASGKCYNNSPAYHSKYKLQSSYVPNTNDPVIGINMVLHIFQPSPLSSGIYSKYGTSSFNNEIELENLFTEATYGMKQTGRYSTTRQASYAYPQGFSVQYINDSKIEYNLVKVYYYQDNYLFNLLTYPILSNGDIVMNYIKNNFPGRLDEGLPIISLTPLTTPHVDLYGSGANARPVVYIGLSAGYDSQSHFSYQMANMRALRHELGHITGLGHPYDDEHLDCNNLDYLSDLLPQNNAANCQNRVLCDPNDVIIPMDQACQTCYEYCHYGTNNIMSESAFSSDTRWMSPLQMGRRIRNMHLQGSGWSFGLRSYASPNYSEHNYPLEVNTNETWDFDIQMYRDIRVKTNSTLRIRCKVAMAIDGKIIVEKGAKLVIEDGGEVTGWCKKMPIHAPTNSPLWQGIEVEGTPNQHQLINNFTGYSPHHGIIEVKTLGTITHARRGISTCLTDISGNYISGHSGGIVFADNAIFENNVFDIFFNNNGSTATVKSKITNCTFKTTGEIGRDVNNQQIIPHERIKLFKHHGVKIEGCRFEYTAGNTYPANQRGAGIYATDSYFTVDQFCANGNCAGATRNVFKNLVYGVFVDNINPLYSANIKNSDFENNAYGVLCENANNMVVSENNVTMNGNLVGMYMYKSKYYNIKNNSLTGDANAYGKGIVAYDSQNGSHKIYRNSFHSLDNGIQAIDNNGGTNTSATGLKMNCNDFATGMNRYDIVLTKSLSSMPLIELNQGHNNPNDLVRNLYNAAYFGSGFINKIYVHPSSNQSIVHISTPTGNDNPNVPNIQASPQINVFNTNTPLDYNTKCLITTPSSGGGGNTPTQKIDNINTYLGILHEFNNNQGENVSRHEIQSANASKLNIFLSEADEDSYQAFKDSAIAMLENNPGEMPDAEVQVVFAHLRYHNYAAAAVKVDALSNETHADWKPILNKIIELEQDTLGYFRIAEDAEATSFFAEYANTEGKDGQACAQTILKLVFGTTHDYPLCDTPVPIQERKSNSENLIQLAEEKEMALIASNISVFPNPSSHNFTIINNNSLENDLELEVKDLLGKTIYTTFITTNQAHTISTNKWSNGLYVITLTNTNNKVVYKQKIIKQD